MQKSFGLYIGLRRTNHPLAKTVWHEDYSYSLFILVDAQRDPVRRYKPRYRYASDTLYIHGTTTLLSASLSHNAHSQPTIYFCLRHLESLAPSISDSAHPSTTTVDYIVKLTGTLPLSIYTPRECFLVPLPLSLLKWGTREQNKSFATQTLRQSSHDTKKQSLFDLLFLFRLETRWSPRPRTRPRESRLACRKPTWSRRQSPSLLRVQLALSRTRMVYQDLPTPYIDTANTHPPSSRTIHSHRYNRSCLPGPAGGDPAPDAGVPRLQQEMQRRAPPGRGIHPLHEAVRSAQRIQALQRVQPEVRPPPRAPP